MVQHAGADDLVELHAEFTHALDRKLVQLQIVEPVPVLEFLGAAHAGGAEVDASHLRCGPSDGVLGRLRSAAACDQDRRVLPVGQGRLEQVMVSASPLRVGPQLAVVVEAVDRPGIGVALVEGLDVTHRPGRRRRGFCEGAHRIGIIKENPRQTHGLPGIGPVRLRARRAPQSARADQPPFCPAARLASTASSEKVPTFWLGGNSLKVAMYLPMNSCAGTNMNTRSRRQWS